MARRSKLTPAQIRQIFRSADTAKVLASRYRVSEQTIYLIRAGRAHGPITKGLAASPKRRQRGATAITQINLDALADKIIERLIRRLKGRG